MRSKQSVKSQEIIRKMRSWQCSCWLLWHFCEPNSIILSCPLILQISYEDAISGTELNSKHKRWQNKTVPHLLLGATATLSRRGGCSKEVRVKNLSDHQNHKKINFQGNTSRTGDSDTLSSRMMDSLSGLSQNPALRISMTHWTILLSKVQWFRRGLRWKIITSV